MGTKIGPTTVGTAQDIVVSLVGSGATTLTLQATGGGSYTGAFQVSNDGQTWAAQSGTPQAGGSPVSSASGDGFWIFTVTGFGFFRLHVSAVVTPEAFTIVTGL